MSYTEKPSALVGRTILEVTELQPPQKGYLLVLDDASVAVVQLLPAGIAYVPEMLATPRGPKMTSRDPFELRFPIPQQPAYAAYVPSRDAEQFMTLHRPAPPTPEQKEQLLNIAPGRTELIGVDGYYALAVVGQGEATTRWIHAVTRRIQEIMSPVYAAEDLRVFGATQ